MLNQTIAGSANTAVATEKTPNSHMSISSLPDAMVRNMARNKPVMGQNMIQLTSASLTLARDSHTVAAAERPTSQPMPANHALSAPSGATIATATRNTKGAPPASGSRRAKRRAVSHRFHQSQI